MSKDETLYAAAPNRVLASGAETLDAIGLAFVIRPSGITIEARTGSLSERTITVDYADVFAVELVDEVAYGVRIETAETEYTVTNLTASIQEAQSVVEAMRERITGLHSRGSTAPDSTPDHRTEPSAESRAESASATDGGGTRASPKRERDPPAADGTESGPESSHSDKRHAGSTQSDDIESETESERPDAASSLGSSGDEVVIYSGDTIECPACDHTTLVPDSIPPEHQDVVCPGCSTVIGRTHEEGECVYIDPDATVSE